MHYIAVLELLLFINSKSISKLKKKLLQWGKLRNDEKMFHIH